MRSKLFLCWTLFALILDELLAFEAVYVGKNPKTTDLDFKEQKHLELELSQKLITEIDSYAAKLFIVIDQQLEHQFVFTITGFDPLDDDFNKQAGDQITGTTSLQAGSVIAIGSDSPLWPSVKKSKSAFVELTAKGQASGASITYFVSEEAPLMNGERYNIMTEGIGSIKINVEVNKSKDENHHFKFMVDAPRIKTSAAISALGWKGDIQTTDKTFNLTRFDQGKLGYVIDKQSKLYCSEDACLYHVHILLDHVNQIEVYFGDHKGIENLRETTKTIGEIKSDSQKENFFTYPILTKPEPLVFTLIPVEGNANLYVNPGFRADNRSQYYYRAEGSAAKRVIASQRDLTGMKLTDSKFYIQVHCPSTCKYVLKAEKIVDDIFMLAPGYSETGYLSGKELRQHIVESRNYDGSNLEKKYSVKLQTYRGQANLFVKNCEEGKLCLVDSMALLANDSSVKVNREHKPYKETHFNIFCSKTKPASLPADEIYSQTCSINVAVEGEVEAGTGLVRYELSVEDDMSSHLMHLNHFSYVRLHPSQTRKYSLSLPNPASTTDSLVFSFDGKYGKFKVCLRVDKTDGPCSQESNIDGMGVGLHEAYKRLVVDYSDKRKIGTTYNLDVKAEESGAGVIIGAVEMTGGQYTSMTAREIKAGLEISDQILDLHQSAYYTFEVADVSGTKGVDSVSIRIHPTQGKYQMVVRNDDIKPTPELYQWKTLDNDLLITQDDPWFKPTGRYVIGIFPVVEGLTATDYRYSLRWSYTDKHNILMPGRIEYNSLNGNRQCYVSEILPSHTSVLFVKNTNSNVTAFISLGNEHHLPAGHNHHFKIDPTQAGLELNASIIGDHCQSTFQKSHHCNAYICLYGADGDPITLAFSPNKVPFTLSPGKIFTVPLPVGSEELRFIYYPEKGRSVDVEEFSKGLSCQISASIQDQNETFQWPKSDYTDTGMSSLIHVPIEKIKGYLHPVILVVLRKAEHTKHLATNFDFNTSVGVEAGADIKELAMDRARQGYSLQGMWTYFYFYNHRPDQGIVINLQSLDGGDGEIFVSRGIDQRPSEFKHMAKSEGFRTTYLELTPSMLKAKGYSDMKGYYAIGLLANRDMHFSISWRHESSSIVFIDGSHQRSINIKPGRSAHLLFYNIFDADIELALENHHHPVVVFWKPVTNTVASTADEFPNKLEYSKRWEIPSTYPISLLTVSKEALGASAFAKYLYTIQNLNLEDPIVVEVNVNVKGELGKSMPPSDLKAGITLFDALAGNDHKRYRMAIPLSKKDLLSQYYLEVQLVTGQGRLDVTPPNLMKADEVYFRQELTIGFNKISLKQLADNQQFKQTNTFNGVAMAENFIVVNCHANCIYRITLVKPEHFTQLMVNHPREAFVSDDGTSETFMYEASGMEKKFEVYLTITEFMGVLSAKLDDVAIKSVVSLWHVKQKSQVYDANLRSKLNVTVDADGAGGKVHFSSPVAKGFYIVEVKGFKGLGFKYRVEVSTDYRSTLLPARQSLGSILENGSDMTFEYYPSGPGTIMAKVQRCYGDVNFKLSQVDSSLEKKLTLDSNRFEEVFQSDQQVNAIFFRAIKTPNKGKVKDAGTSFLDLDKNISIFTVEVMDSGVDGVLGSSLMSLLTGDDQIKPIDEDITVDLKANPPVIHFRPIEMPDHIGKHSIRYSVAISRDPLALEYYAACDYALMSKVLKPGYSPKDVIQVFDLDPQAKPSREVSTLKPYFSIPLKLETGRRYFALVFAQVTLNSFNNEEMNVLLKGHNMLESLRVHYARIDFEYRSYFYPIELLAATIGLIGLVAASCCIFNNQLLAMIKRRLRFKKIEESEVDADLEDYFMKIKYEYDSQMSVRDHSSLDHLDDSTLTHTTARPSQQPIELDDQTKAAANDQRDPSAGDKEKDSELV